MQIHFDNINLSQSTVDYKLILNNDGLGKLIFSGVYKQGSKGNVDGYFMEAVVNCTIKHELVKSLIVDLQDVDYTWGNTIINTMSLLSAANIPVAIIYGEKSKGIVNGDESFFVRTELEALDVINRLSLSKNLSNPLK
ncbi:hypothetical protein [Pedobacter nanyangensis]|uniref:hypothetical protein n=1 Tax=Pedobacter nanyangensis TaxID=1562389 RepID=UPI000DE29738|nr:hypothetical protein [Pedobacter nanyangensis]